MRSPVGDCGSAHGALAGGRGAGVSGHGTFVAEVGSLGSAVSSGHGTLVVYVGSHVCAGGRGIEAVCFGVSGLAAVVGTSGLVRWSSSAQIAPLCGWESAKEDSLLHSI